MEPLDFDAVLVDGQNVSRTDAMMLQQSTARISVRKFFAADDHRELGWYGGMEFVDVPVQGREDVDRAIAMEAVRLHVVQGVQRLLLVSHDMDYGATAIYLRSMFPEMQVSIAASPTRVKQEYLSVLTSNSIPFIPLFDMQRPAMTAALYAMWKHQKDQHPDKPVRLQDMHDALVKQQHIHPRLHAPHMANDLMEFGFSCVNPDPIRRDARGKALPQKHVPYSHVLAPSDEYHHV